MRTKLVNGERVELTPEENAARDAEEAAWAETARTNAANKKKSDIKAVYDARCKSCGHMSFVWQADRASVGAIVAKHHVLENSPPATAVWHDADNAARTLDWSEFVSLKDRLFNYHEDCFNNQQVHKNAVDDLVDSSTPASIQEIEDYDITTGWPT